MSNKVKSLKDLSAAQLDATAEFFGSDFSTAKNKADKLAILTEDGVSVEQYNQFVAEDDVEEQTVAVEVEEEDAPVFKVAEKTEETVLLKMDRANSSYEIRGYRFTRDHPYVTVSVDDANYICSKVRGFRVAFPQEVQEFYN